MYWLTVNVTMAIFAPAKLLKQFNRYKSWLISKTFTTSKNEINAINPNYKSIDQMIPYMLSIIRKWNKRLSKRLLPAQLKQNLYNVFKYKWCLTPVDKTKNRKHWDLEINLTVKHKISFKKKLNKNVSYRLTHN